MTEPAAVRVRVPRGARLPFVGRYGGEQQFLSTLVLAGPAGARGWYAVLHTFDAEGRHAATRVFAGGPEGDPGSQRRAGEQQQLWLRQLSTMLLGGIDVEPFAHREHGLVFGIEPAGAGWTLQPGGEPLG